MSRPARIVSGAQTGADEGALRAAAALGIQTGGFCPREARSERGNRPWLIGRYRLTELPTRAYLPRTIRNIEDADVTLLFGEVASPGSRKTLEAIRARKKPYWVNPNVSVVYGLYQCTDKREWTVNIAGNRESVNRGIEAYVYRLLLEAWAREDQRELLRAAPWPDPLPRLTEGDLT